MTGHERFNFTECYSVENGGEIFTPLFKPLSVANEERTGDIPDRAIVMPYTILKSLFFAKELELF